MKLSVIVPVYNVEKYLPRCLDSLLRQGMQKGEWEVICVNDGFPDNCAAILAEYEKNYLIRKQNENSLLYGYNISDGRDGDCYYCQS